MTVYQQTDCLLGRERGGKKNTNPLTSLIGHDEAALRGGSDCKGDTSVNQEERGYPVAPGLTAHRGLPPHANEPANPASDTMPHHETAKRLRVCFILLKTC